MCLFVSLSFLVWVACLVSPCPFLSRLGRWEAPFAFFRISVSDSGFALPPSSLSSCLLGPTVYQPLSWGLGHGAEEGSALEGRGSRPRSPTGRRWPLSVPWGEGLIRMTTGVGGFSLSSMVEELRLEGELGDNQVQSTCRVVG